MKRKPPVVSDIDVAGKKVWVRIDLDVSDFDNPRVESAINVVKWLKEHGAKKITAAGHRGDVGVVEKLSEEMPDVDWSDGLRDDPREKENSEEMAAELGRDFDVYVNESFAVSHRRHTSLVALPLWMKKNGKQVAVGLRFAKELEYLSEIISGGQNKRRILVAGGTKVEDKLKFGLMLAEKLDLVLMGGRIPQYIKETGIQLPANVVALGLRGDGLDIDDEAIKLVVEEVSKADEIVAAGVMGKYEEPSSEKGTKEVLQAISSRSGLKIAGGGDIEAAISKYGLEERFNWISVGGGAMLEFLGQGSLLGLDAIVD